MKKIKTLTLILGAMFIMSCKQQHVEEPSQQLKPIVEKSDQKCGITNCHGLDMQCGSNVPDFCTEEYRLGDFCRKYFIGCEVQEGRCVEKLANNDDQKFKKCKSCVKECGKLSGESAFKCEDGCREQMG